MKRGLLFLLLIVGCQTKDARVLSSTTAKPTPDGLPRARSLEPMAVAPGSPPQVSRGESAERLNPGAVIFPRNAAVREKWAQKRDQILQAQQRRLDQFHARKEGITGRSLPRTQLGETNPHPPRLDSRVE